MIKCQDIKILTTIKTFDIYQRFIVFFFGVLNSAVISRPDSTVRHLTHIFPQLGPAARYSNPVKILYFYYTTYLQLVTIRTHI